MDGDGERPAASCVPSNRKDTKVGEAKVGTGNLLIWVSWISISKWRRGAPLQRCDSTTKCATLEAVGAVDRHSHCRYLPGDFGRRRD